MTDLETLLHEIRERADKATEGPWSNLDEPGELHSCVLAEPCGDPFHIAMQITRPEDEDFIAHARTDVPRLVKALEVALNFIDHLHNCIDEPCGSCVVEDMVKKKLHGEGSDELGR